MTHPRSEFTQLAVPGIGYLQNLSIERDLIGNVRNAQAPVEDREPLEAIDYLAGAFVIVAMAFGPLVVTLI
jgi:hypothetical protein